jgi:hypothetical protein
MVFDCSVTVRPMPILDTQHRKPATIKGLHGNRKAPPIL